MSDTRILSQLFPSSFCPVKRPLTKAFDPASECVALPQQKKKKAFRSKPNLLWCLIHLMVFERQISKNVRRSRENTERCPFMKYRINCLQGFSHLQNLVGFTLLEAGQGGKLHPSKNQEPDGEYMIVDARRKSGPIYLHPTLVGKLKHILWVGGLT